MNHRTGFNALSRTSAHRRAMLRNMVTSLFRFERITTTKAKAKEARRKAEKLVTRATRILKLGFREGDAADVVILELVDYNLEQVEEKKAADKAKKDAKKADKKGAAKKEAKESK